METSHIIIWRQTLHFVGVKPNKTTYKGNLRLSLFDAATVPGSPSNTSNTMIWLVVADLVNLALEVVDHLRWNLVTEDLVQVDPLVSGDRLIRC